LQPNPTIEDPAAFAMEKHLEVFLASNWEHTELAKTFSIFGEDGEEVGQQYQTDAGPIDILPISKDRKRLLVVELKRGVRLTSSLVKSFATWAT
jgi:restriction system protein